MPVVPTRDNFSVKPTTAPSSNIRNTMSPEGAAAGAAQVSAMGDAMQRTAQRGAEIRLDIMDEANQLRVADAVNQAREHAIRLQHDPKEGYTQFKGYDALNRPDGVPLGDEYAGKLETTVGSIAATLGNDAQKNAFAAASGKLLSDFKNDAVRYEGSEFRDWSMSVREGTIKNQTQNIALNYDNPEKVNESLASIRASAIDLARQQGKSAEEMTSLSRDAMSKGHTIVIETAVAKGKIRYADDYFKKAAKDMAPDDILRGHALLTGELDKVVAVETATNVMQSQRSNIDTPDSDRAFNIAVGAESSGQHFGGAGSVAGPNEPTTSAAGAIGIAQVMPATGPEAAQMAGLVWDENKFKNDPAYNHALGKAYFTQQLKDFGGNIAKAYAAYNAGPQRLKDGIAKAEAAGEPENWVNYMPKETQAYVSRNMKAYKAGQGVNERPTLTAVQDQVRAALGPDADPTRVRLALDEAERQYTDVTKSIAQRDEQRVANAMRALVENGGDYKSLPADMRANLPPDKITSVMDFAKRISNGDNTTDLSLYNKFEQNPRELAALTDDQFVALRQSFSDTDFKHFSQVRASILNGNQPEAQNPGSLNTGAIKTTLDDRLAQLGINPSPKNTDVKANARVGTIRQFVNNEIAKAQAQAGKKFTDAETSSFIDSLFSKKAIFDGYISDSEGPMLKMKTGDIPPITKKALVNAYKKQYGMEPSDGDLMQIYWAHLVRIGQIASAQTQGVN